MHTEAQRRRDGRIAAGRCLEASRIAVDEETRDLLQRVAVRYMLKAIGIETQEVGAPALATGAETPKVRRGVHAAPGGKEL